jgi:hypothetical protein
MGSKITLDAILDSARSLPAPPLICGFKAHPVVVAKLFEKYRPPKPVGIVTSPDRLYGLKIIADSIMPVTVKDAEGRDVPFLIPIDADGAPVMQGPDGPMAFDEWLMQTFLQDLKP